MASIQPIPVIRGIYLKLIMDVLRRSRRDYAIYLRRFNLPRALPDGLDTYVPLKALLSFSQWAAACTGIEDIGFHAARRMQISDLNVGLHDALLCVPTLEAALRTFCAMAEREQAPLRYRMLQKRDEVWICSSPEGGPPLSDLDNCGEWLRIMPVLAIIRYFADQSWTPTALTFRSRHGPGKRARRAFFRTQLMTDSALTGLVFPASLLRPAQTGPGRRKPTMCAPHGRTSAHTQPTWDFPTSLRAVLRAYLDDGSPSIELAAEIACTSVRTLQRRLRQYDLSYTDLVAQTQFETAKHLLRDCSTTLTDIAYTAGYSAPTNFSRAFRRMAGVSPHRYRALSHATLLGA